MINSLIKFFRGSALTIEEIREADKLREEEFAKLDYITLHGLALAWRREPNANSEMSEEKWYLEYQDALVSQRVSQRATEIILISDSYRLKFIHKICSALTKGKKNDAYKIIIRRLGQNHREEALKTFPKYKSVLCRE